MREVNLSPQNVIDALQETVQEQQLQIVNLKAIIRALTDEGEPEEEPEE